MPRGIARRILSVLAGLTLGGVVAVVPHAPAQALPNVSWGSGGWVESIEKEHANYGGGTGTLYGGTNGCTASISGFDFGTSYVGNTWNNQISSHYTNGYASPYVRCVAYHYDNQNYGVQLFALQESANHTSASDRTASLRLT